MDRIPLRSKVGPLLPLGTFPIDPLFGPSVCLCNSVRSVAYDYEDKPVSERGYEDANKLA
jgi:hypothetical protein